MIRPRRDVEPRRSPTDDLSPVDLAVVLSRLPSTHPLVTAARTGIEVGQMREDRGLNLDDYAGGRFHRPAEFAEHSEIQRRRWGPTGDREQWVRYGDAGPPVPRQREAADSKECLQPDLTAAAVAQAYEACRDAVNARQEEERAAELNRWAACDRTEVDADVMVRVADGPR